jgi:hypothetical protein
MLYQTICIAALTLLSACNSLPQLYQAFEDVADDDAIHLTVSREAIQKDTNVKVSIAVENASTKQ